MSIRLYDCLLAPLVPPVGDELLIFLLDAPLPFYSSVIRVLSPRRCPSFIHRVDAIKDFSVSADSRDGTINVRNYNFRRREDVPLSILEIGCN